ERRLDGVVVPGPVEPDDEQVTGDAASPLGRRPDGADGHLVVAGEDAVDAACDQVGASGEARRAREVARHDQRFVDGPTGTRVRESIADESGLRVGPTGPTGDATDPLAPLLHEASDGPRGRLDVRRVP